MVIKPYSWEEGAELEEHTRRKHKVLREYFARYLTVRCQPPQQARFRLAVIDGFAGGGRYACGAPGSPLIFLAELRNATEQVNLKRASDSMPPLEIECLLILNDARPEVAALLRDNVEPLIAAVKEEATKLHLRVEYFNRPFEQAYPDIKNLLDAGGYRNVFFNLDQCGYSDVEVKTIVDVMQSFHSAEILYTFAIKSLLAFLPKAIPEKLATNFGVSVDDLGELSGLMSRQEWLGAAERLVFDAFRSYASYVSPFSINNPEGWRYWLILFSNSHRARQEYNNILHNNSTMQAHFGRSGLNMLSYDPADLSGGLYLFEEADRKKATDQLSDDIPRLISDFGDAVGVSKFYQAIYNDTPAHMDDIHEAIMRNPDLEVITAAGGERRKFNTITTTDTLRLTRQRTFFPIFFGRKSPK